MGALQLQLRRWAGDPVVPCLVVPVVFLSVSFSEQNSYTYLLKTGLKQYPETTFFSFPLFDLNGSVIVLKSFRSGRDIDGCLLQPLDLTGEITEA